MTDAEGLTAIKSSIPARLDRLPWSHFHRRVVIALGITWILDGLEVTFEGAISGVLQSPLTLGLSPAQIGFIGSTYVAGAVIGALGFGYLTDRHGRKKMFFMTLAVYLAGVMLSAISWNMETLALFRFITGLGIGGEYSAINSAIDELIPASRRGRIDMVINGSYWIGAAIASMSTLLILNDHIFALNVGWRVGFAVGGALGLGVLLMRRHIPESPRWLLLHGGAHEAERIVGEIEKSVEAELGAPLPPPEHHIVIYPKRFHAFRELLHVILVKYRRRAVLSLTLMTSQAFLYNAIFFSYAMVLTQFYNVPIQDTGLYLLPFAIGNFLGPVCLGRFFDTIGRRIMIAAVYLLSGLLLCLTGYLFNRGVLTAETQTLLWSVIFFFASSAASSAYLTISEIFPIEVRGFAIALFFSIGTGIGGVGAPFLYGVLIGTHSHFSLYMGYLFAGLLMIGTAVVEWCIGVDAEQRSLEEIAPPIVSQKEV